MKTKMLSWLLHHANRYYKSNYFYALKSELLVKYGTHIGYDLQYIDGKKCYSCNGTGVYSNYYHGMWHKDQCWNCSRGWYRLPEWNILEVLQFGEYTFHKPWKRCYEKPEIAARNKIESYIEHMPSYWSHIARIILYIIYRRKDYGDRWILGFGGYRCNWFKNFPKNILINIAHLCLQGRDAYPLRNLKFFKKKLDPIPDEELPF